MVENNNFISYTVKAGKVFYSKRDRIEYFKIKFLGHLKNVKIVLPKTIKDNFIVSGNVVKYSPTLLSKLEVLKSNAVGDNKNAISNFKKSLENIIEVTKVSGTRKLSPIE